MEFSSAFIWQVSDQKPLGVSPLNDINVIKMGVFQYKLLQASVKCTVSK